MGLQEFRLFQILRVPVDLVSEIIGRFKGPVVIYSSSNLASLVTVEWVWSGLAFSRQNRGVAPGLCLTLEFHELVVLELVRGCAMTSHFFGLSAKIMFSFNSYLNLYISGFESNGARCKLACQSVKCTFRMKSFSQCYRWTKGRCRNWRIGERGSVYRINLVVLRSEEVTPASLAGAD